MNAKVDKLAETLKELDQVDSGMLTTLFEYQRESQHSNDDLVREIVAEHKSGGNDPACAHLFTANVMKKA